MKHIFVNLLTLMSVTHTIDAWNNQNYTLPTPDPDWFRRNPYYQTPASNPDWFRRNPYYQTPASNPYWFRRNPYYQTPTPNPDWFSSNPYYQTPAPNPYWYRRNKYYQTPTPNPYWFRRNPYYQTPDTTVDTPTTQYPHLPDVPVPSITVYQQVENREHVIVTCTFGMKYSWSSFQLSVKGEVNYSLKNPACFANDVCVFKVTVKPPAVFTCVHKFSGSYWFGDTYVYSQSVLDHHEGVSSVYIGFASFIILGLIIMTAAVIVIITRSNAKGSFMTVANNDYVDV